MKHTKIFIFGIQLILLITLTSTIYAQEWVWPTVSEYITSDFGPRMLNGWQFHEGIDIRAPIGTDVYAVEDGTFRWIGGLNGIAEVTHDNMMVSRYLHCQRFVGASPRRVSAGDRIALSGTAGTTVAHLHFDFNPRGEGDADHPLRYLPYNNTSDPTVSQFENPNDGDIVSG
jgi:murein DD-endopeptidase MepM/ murein hydrolase activator NlpD